ncbi:MAG: hypothetical protein K6F53_08865 [Lachnospiraceae bacterium]|nr:hypothetical protein [Lachnospiraceae bacterium]
MLKRMLSFKKHMSFGRLKEQKDKGSGLITTLVGVSFILILAAIIMTVSFANVQMKQISYRNRKNFYENETGLNDIYSGMGRDVTKRLTEAYSEILSQINTEDPDADPLRADEQNKYYARFAGRFHKKLDLLFAGRALSDLHTEISPTENTDVYTNVMGLLGGYITDASNTKVLDVKAIDKDAEGVALTKYVLEDVTIDYIENRDGGADPDANANRFRSVVTTDIVIEVPYIFFFNDFSRVADFAMIANKGVYFRGADYTIDGSVYAGIHEGVVSGSVVRDFSGFDASYNGYQYGALGDDFYDGMNLYGSTVTVRSGQVISKGDINLCESTLQTDPSASSGSSGAGISVWAENIRTVEDANAVSGHSRFSYLSESPDPGRTKSRIDMNADFYVADDLELSSEECEVILGGNYYGYNFNNGGTVNYDTKETDAIRAKYGGTVEHTTSSSIVVNANASRLDISRLNSLLLSGLASIDASDPTVRFSDASKSVSEYKTGESLAARYNQMLYLAPERIMLSQNPKINGPTVLTADVLQNICPPKGTLLDPAEPLRDTWFGWDYVNETIPVKAVAVNLNGSTVVYYMLNFESETKKSEYLKFVMEADPASADDKVQQAAALRTGTVDPRIAGMGLNGNIVIDAPSTSIVTNGYLSQGGTQANTNMGSAVTVAVSSRSMGDQYGNLVKYLSPLDTLSPEERAIATALTEDRLPAELFISYAASDYAGNPLWSGVTSSCRSLRSGNVVIINNSADDPVGLSSVFTPEVQAKVAADGIFHGIVIANGNISIDCSVDGLVISSGKILLTGGPHTLTANSALVNSIISEEQKNLVSISVTDTAYMQGLASYYFQDTHSFVSEAADTFIDTENRILSTNYTDYIYFRNWRKGE